MATLIETTDLKTGDVIVEHRRVKGKNKEVRTKVKSVRRGGHTPAPRLIGKDKETGAHVISEPVAVDPVPGRLIPLSKIVVNENSVYDRVGKVLVDR